MSRKPAPQNVPTTEVDADEVRRMAEASKVEACLDCARVNSENEALRKELHCTHSRVQDLEARLQMIAQVVARVAEQVDVLSGRAA